MARIVQLAWRRTPRSMRRLIVAAYPLPMFRAGVLALVVNGRNEVLLLRHLFRAKPWGLPGGWLHRGEDPVHGMCRELREELGLELDPSDLEHIAAICRKDRSHIEIFFRVHADVKSTPQCIEYDRIGYFPPDDLPQDLLEEHTRIITRALADNRR